MNDDNISINSRYSSNPRRYRKFTVHFFHHRILTTVTSTPSVVRSWISKIRHIHLRRLHKLVVGLGVRWRPYHAGGSPGAATLQLCVGCHCLIFQLCHATSVPLALCRFLSKRDFTFVGVWNHRDNAMLLRSRHRLSVTNLVDIRVVAHEKRGLDLQSSMEKLAHELLDFENVKKLPWIGRSAWDASSLSREQVQYASVDAFLSFSMGKALGVWSRSYCDK